MTTLLKRTSSKLVGASLAATMVMTGSPAFANSSSNAAAADVTEPLREAQAETLATGDKKFRELFASWVALDKAGPDAPVERTTVAIPSLVPVAGARMSSAYGMRRHPVRGGWRMHKGVDLAAPTGTPVYASADGMVGRADWFSSYGLFIRIDHGADMETRYAHLSKLAVAAGERVRKGDLIGYVGSTGRSTGPHLHYEVRVGGVAVDPIPYMVDRTPLVASRNDDEMTGSGGE